MTFTDGNDGPITDSARCDLELLRLARLADVYDQASSDTIEGAARGWTRGLVELTPTDTTHLVEALFKLGKLSEAALVAKKRATLNQPLTAFDDFALQYQRLANYDLQLPPHAQRWPLFTPPPSGNRPRVLSLYHSSITFQASGYTMRSQALLSSSALDVIALTRIGYPWAAKVAKGLSSKISKDGFESSSGTVTYHHRRGQVTKQSLTFSNIALGKHEIMKAVCEHKPHLVHAASNFVNALPALLAARECGIPFVYEMRGLWELTAGVGIPGWLQSERYLLERRIETFVAAAADRVIVLSDVQRAELIERGLDPARIDVVMNGHDSRLPEEPRAASLLAEHCPGLHDWVGGRTLIGYAGALAVYEGLQDLLTVLAARRDAWKHVALVVAGDGPYLPQLREQITALGLEDRVRLLGRLPSAAAEALYSAVDLCVLPRRPDLVSRLITPLKTVEILAHGKVLLASDVAAVAEQLARYGYGESFRAGDCDDLARQLDRVMSDLPALKARYAGARQRIGHEFSWNVIGREWDRVLGGVASQLGPKPAILPARNALGPLYDWLPTKQLDRLPTMRRLGRVVVSVDEAARIYLRCPAALGRNTLRVLAMPIDEEVAHEATFGSATKIGDVTVHELSALQGGKYALFVYIDWQYADTCGNDISVLRAASADQPPELREVIPLRYEARQLLAFEVTHDAANPTELCVFSDHPGRTRVALSYVPLRGAELNANYGQLTKSKVTGTRFRYINLDHGPSDLALFPRLHGPVMVEITPWAEGEILDNQIRQVARVRYVARENALYPTLDRKRTNVLVAANINETLLDGSTIWLKTLVNTLAAQPGVNVYVVTNAVHVSNGVTAEIFDKPNVAKIDVACSSQDRIAEIAKQIRLLDRTSGGFDLVIVRGIEFAQGIVDNATRDRVVYYGAGMFRREHDGSVSVDDTALRLAARCSAVIFQNSTMERMFRERQAAYRGTCYCMPPCVEDSAVAMAVAEERTAGEKLVVYAGKLIREYGVVELLEAARGLVGSALAVRVVVLGNKFDGRDPDYQKQFAAAVERLAGAVTWLPAVAPSVALRWVARADVVWGWRHGAFETSHFEISTKMVEAISCGSPIVVYPSVANRELLGANYAGFADSAADAAHALVRLLASGRATFRALFDDLRPRFSAARAYAPLLERVTLLTHRRSRSPARAKPSILIAAHDFRFFEQIEAGLLELGHTVTREYWKSHSVRLVQGETRAAEEADIVFCEWCLGNAVWWSHNLPPGKKLFLRLHLQELNTAYPGDVDFSRVEGVIFVSEHVMREAIAKFAIPQEKCQVIPISVKLDAGASYSKLDMLQRRDTLGMVGLTPWRKRPDRALELFLSLRERYPNLRLHLKGHTPSEYQWMSTRRAELAQYRAFFAEVARLERSGIARLSGYDDQLEDFYRGAGWILSLSDFEGCHTAVAEGGVMGCLPLMTGWDGADGVYPKRLVQTDLADVERYFTEHYETFEQSSSALRAEFQRQFSIDHVFPLWRDLLLGKLVNRFEASVAMVGGP
jgi:glycosyltransferase involved in cell wall biosynthesis